MEEKTFEELKYLISYPEGFQKDKKYPLVIFLHGAGFRDETTDRLQKNACVTNFLKRQDARGYVFLAPLCKSGNWYEWMSVLVSLVKTYREMSYIDETRVHLTGNSMGGYGTWALATLHPNWFASAMPISGGGIGAFAMNLINLPVRAFHGLRDKTVDPIESLQMVKAVNMYGGHAELILFPELEHNCWDEVYSDEKNYDWLLSFTANPDQSLVEDLSTTYYGNKKISNNC
ncbi:MAG: dienelactone hydrolase family protein [Clostridia bacterium]|nr:dienelactone hydrolase family protein [Clostridia bacterium]